MLALIIKRPGYHASIAISMHLLVWQLAENNLVETADLRACIRKKQKKKKKKKKECQK